MKSCADDNNEDRPTKLCKWGLLRTNARERGGGADDPNKRLENKLMVKIITIIIKPYLKKTICSPSETPQKDRDI